MALAHKPCRWSALVAVLLAGCIFSELDNGDEMGGEDDLVGEGDDGMGEGYCGPTEGWDATASGLESRVVELVNEARATGGNCGGTQFGPAVSLASQPALTCAARVHSLDMAARDFFDHDNPDGDDPFVRMERAGYSYSAAGENIAAGQPSAEDVVAGWLQSPGHCRNILDPGFVHIGVGYVFTDAASFPYYWTQTFGAPL